MNIYLLLKTVHILGVIIFLGNILVTGWWKIMADRTHDPQIIAFAQRQVILTDIVLTSTGVVLILASGIANAILFDMNIFSVRWLSWSLWLFAASGVIWLLVLLPVQIKQYRMSKIFANDGCIPEAYWQLCKIWGIFGTLATILPLFSVYWMVFKPV